MPKPSKQDNIVKDITNTYRELQVLKTKIRELVPAYDSRDISLDERITELDRLVNGNARVVFLD